MLEIGIIVLSVREKRIGKGVANWVYEEVLKRSDSDTKYELVDLIDYPLPLLGTTVSKKELEVIKSWQRKMSMFDGYIYVTPEYNSSIPGAFKNASDYLKSELRNKVVSFVGYGGVGAARAIEQHRSNVAVQQMIAAYPSLNLLLHVDFINQTIFVPQPHHVKGLNLMIERQKEWLKALKTIKGE